MSIREQLAKRAWRSGVSRHRASDRPQILTDAAGPHHPGIGLGTLPGTPAADVIDRPLPAIGGQQARWICEYCYVMAFRDEPPPSWGTVVGTGSVCGDCMERIEADGGYGVVAEGAYAEGADPRNG